MASDLLEILRTRKSTTDTRLKQLAQRLDQVHSLVNDYACVYATGSVGRGEASTFSDLDVFIKSYLMKKASGTLSAAVAEED